MRACGKDDSRATTRRASCRTVVLDLEVERLTELNFRGIYDMYLRDVLRSAYVCARASLARDAVRRAASLHMRPARRGGPMRWENRAGRQSESARNRRRVARRPRGENTILTNFMTDECTRYEGTVMRKGYIKVKPSPCRTVPSIVWTVPAGQTLCVCVCVQCSASSYELCIAHIIL